MDLKNKLIAKFQLIRIISVTVKISNSHRIIYLRSHSIISRTIITLILPTRARILERIALSKECHSWETLSGVRKTSMKEKTMNMNLFKRKIIMQ